ncbi:MAG: VPLPA-CTERM-specific exosortase XrtD [Gammaproteobacteria bacterium]|nr:VPLPA-CTERM-specific exosortase XrtD [Gammaproteobacteria bacterium]MCP4090127.1 VPLPA-CTERM-specific exosortase XrtD [Gammaproteobacteria bacterium]MCP4276983.1 VPLPA-CTERM-specific exosortase XrtD [Gammaproteobacteria bacterium]MCP4831755.1 VPLPA-CTERM-specific exosortase XrtD [Gammaproteobacteria bacterium]MCP4929490.1 VPLPA-CTERM-specific exosortase XrtD [Gammaproteobacteria bacterium]
MSKKPEKNQTKAQSILQPIWLRALPLVVLLGVLIYAYRVGLLLMVDWWERMPEYNHGYLIPVVSAYLLLLCADQYRQAIKQHARSGLIVVILGLLLLVLGELSAVYTIIQYGFLVSLTGLIITAVGWRATLTIWTPLVYLFFMIPLPDFLYKNLSAELQLFSSQFGVTFLRMVGVSVYLEGNVIDLGVFQLQVAEACSGLRYLFPLMSFGFLCACLFKGSVWQKVFIFLSSIPITLFMNSFRIAVIGLLVDNYGISMARGFLHDFEGWIIFMACVGILMLEMAIFAIFSQKKLVDLFDVQVPPLKDFEVFLPTVRPSPIWAAIIVVVLGTSFATIKIQDREEFVPEAEPLSTFPLRVDEWRGREQAIEQVYLDQLKLDDYLVAQYSSPAYPTAIELYIAYYKSQRKGASVHSPRACLPGGGWEITDFDQHMVSDVGPNKSGLKVNRAVISMGKDRQLVYYWFQQRDRILTNEYMVKWFIFWDALTKNRTDGALIRLTTRVPAEASLDEADAQMQAFIQDFDPALAYYLPRTITVADDI